MGTFFFVERVEFPFLKSFEEKYATQQNGVIKNYISQFNKIVQANNITFIEALYLPLTEEISEDFNIILLDSKGKLYVINDEDGDEDNGENYRNNNRFQSDINLSYQFLHISQIDFYDGQGMLFISKENPEESFDLDSFIAATIAVIIFILSLILLTSHQIKYIGQITDGIEIMAGGRLSHKIKVKGNNEFSNLASQINKMSSSLKEKMIKEKNIDIKQRKLIANISHDLRTPLTSLIGYLDLLKKNDLKDSTTTEQYINVSYNKSKRLESLINDLFTYTKLINNDVAISTSKINLSNFVKQFFGENEFMLQENNLNLKLNICNDNTFTEIDIDQTLRVFENLISNIIKYSEKDTDVTVEVSTNKNNIVVKLKNYSKNDLLDDVNSIFERLYICDESRQNDSSGMGLAIVKEIMKLQKGEIYADWNKPYLTLTLQFPKIII